MFSIAEKQHIAAILEKALLELNHPEMPKNMPMFKIHIDGKESWSFADIEPNWKVGKNPEANPWNESARDLLKP